MTSVLACKYFGKGKDHEEERAKCLAKNDGSRWSEGHCINPAPGFTTQEQCLAIQGAHWDDNKHQCAKPDSLDDCQGSNKDLVWDGEACIASSSPVNFYRLCIDEEASDEIKHTIAVMSRIFTPASCQEAYDQLREKTSMTYHGEDIRDLSPFEGFKQLKELDLWNNKLEEISPLENLSNLLSLNLGHNQLANIQSLAKLENLERLIISENQIINIKPLAGLEKLEYLDISRNQISDLSPLAEKVFKNGYFYEGNPLTEGQSD